MCSLRGRFRTFLYIYMVKAVSYFVSWLWRLVIGFLPRRLGFDSRSVLVAFVVDKLAKREGFIQVQLFSPVSVILPILHTRLHLNTILTRRSNGRSFKIFKHSFPCMISADTGLKSIFTVGVPA
jgi:hypothetical protein